MTKFSPLYSVFPACVFALCLSSPANARAVDALGAQDAPSTSKPQPYAQRVAQAGRAQTDQSASPQLLGQFGDWGVYTANPSGRKVCFALTKPVKAETNPPGRTRDPAYLFIASRPAEQVKDEVSVMFGYAFKGSEEASLEVGGANFPLYTQSDGGWIKNAAEESRLVDALRRGADATVKGVSSRGTTSTDVYSLRGVTQALNKVAEECH